MSKIALNIIKKNLPEVLPYSKRLGLRSMQNIQPGAEREIIEAYKSELTHDIWGDYKKLSEWVSKKFDEIRNKNYSSVRLSKEAVNNDRNEVVKIWSDIIAENSICKNNPFLSLKILRSIVSDLKQNNAQLPPVINLNVFEDAVYEVKKTGSSFKKSYFKLYKQFSSIPDLKTTRVSADGVSGIWYSVHVPDYGASVSQPGMFYKIKEFISVLSQRTNWCTRNPKAVSDQFMGKDFHIFIDKKGCPQICIVGYDQI